MTTTKQAKAHAIEEALADAQAFGHVEADTWRALQTAGVTRREFRRALGAKREYPLGSRTESSVRDMAELVLAA